MLTDDGGEGGELEPFQPRIGRHYARRPAADLSNFVKARHLGLEASGATGQQQKRRGK